MAILIPSANMIFLHIPKTGGSWFKQALYRAEIDFENLYDQHVPIQYLINHMDEDLNDKYIFSIVRHPITWYQSRWCFRIRHGWHVEHPLDNKCASNDFHQFVKNILDFKPGWVTYLYSLYNDGDVSPNKICRIENLVDDTVSALQEAGVKFNENKFRNTPKTNDSNLDGKPSRFWAKYSSELFDEVISAEQEAINKYYPNYEISPDKYCGELPYA